MKKICLIILLALIGAHVYAQSENSEYKIAVDKFINYYNNNQYETIFNEFSPDMQQAMPLQKTNEFFSGLRQQIGKITERNFMKFQSPFAAYQIKFENGVFALNLSIDSSSKIDGFAIRPYIPDNLPQIKRNTTKLILPFRGEWTVFWGGDTEELNDHVVDNAQKNAFDFVIRDESGKSFKNTGSSNEEFYCFGKDLIAPCAGEVVLAVDGIKDNKPGEMNQFFPAGNTVVLKTDKGEYIYFCHFKHHSIKVKERQKVKPGELLGLCGNSGRSSEAHLHFHIQNVEDINIATGVKCYFEKIEVNKEIKTDYSPIKKDKIQNIMTKE